MTKPFTLLYFSIGIMGIVGILRLLAAYTHLKIPWVCVGIIVKAQELYRIPIYLYLGVFLVGDRLEKGAKHG